MKLPVNITHTQIAKPAVIESTVIIILSLIVVLLGFS